MLLFRCALFIMLLIQAPFLMAEEPLPPLKSERLTNKLSLLLRGRPASREEQKVFNETLAKDPKQFQKVYLQLIRNFMKDSGYAAQIAQHHSLWWRVPPGSITQHAGEIVAHDRPYRDIYLRDYLYVNGSDSKLYAYYGVQTLADLPTASTTPLYVPLAPGEQRFRGFFSSPDFLTTYPDTDTNKNRKRSSQVFRIAFCETLQNVPSERMHRDLLPDDAHGSSPDCIGCHRRLDPMARFFDRWMPPFSMSTYAEFNPDAPAAGAVKLGGPDGTARIYEGVSDADLGAIIVKQKEFASCVAKQAWQFAFGAEPAMDAGSAARLEGLYQSGERFNPLIEEVLLNPYFWSQLEPPALHYADVKNLLSNCGSCHAKATVTRFDPVAYPFLPDPDRNAALLGRMWKAINHEGSVRPMPEFPQPRLPLESIEALRAWIISGAQSSPGQRTLSDDQVEEIIE